ncbi:MAG: tryptophan--tRNA ligase [Solibacterales bacterium]|nr:tryptophan--tRNA ligase [Bryobacterales bacterium]|tara:strand:+ start:20475 stop:21476 length:1002 start_codon:yes stop_codon:yes gene_type:complete
MPNKASPVLFSGMQPTGDLHIGNYLGALKTWTAIQYDYRPIYCVVDYHAITVYQEPKALQEKIEEMAALYIAAGIDPEHSTIFVQSTIPQHVELAWVFSCVTPVGWLSRMTQFKTKTEQQESVGTGLFVYPALMAADILLYQAGVVPVGDDQTQHLELTRDIAGRFNSLYGETFVVPKTELPSVGARIMGLDDPTQKMSKSAPGSNHSISLLDSPSRIKKLIGRAVTDTKPAVDFNDLGEGVANLITIYQACSGADNEETREVFSGVQYGVLKKAVTEALVEKLEPLQKKFRDLTADRDVVRGILRHGTERAAPIAEKTMQAVRQKVGLYMHR